MSNLCLRRSIFAAALFAAPLSAQVFGATADKSPLRDLNDGQRVGITGGYLSMGKDPLGIGPKSAPMIGLRYDLHLGGPVYLTVQSAGATTSRTVLAPNMKPGAHVVGSQRYLVLSNDLGLAMSLTGDRSWRSLQPLVHTSVGAVSVPGDKADVGGYSFRTRLAFSLGLGLRYATGRNSELRFDASLHWWSLKYPDSYRANASVTTDPLRPTGTLSPYTSNKALTVSWTRGIFR